MISYLEGKIIFRSSDFIILNVSGVGYKIFVISSSDISGEETKLYTHLAVREDAMTLYGFLTFEELELFERLKKKFNK